MDGWPKPSAEGKISDKAAVLAEIKSPCPLAAEPDADNLARNNFTPKKSEKDLKAYLEDPVSCNKTPSDAPGKSELFKNNFTQQESVSDLSESGLKALLEEAVSYKTPSDVHGKSELFKVLLQSIETDNDYASRGERQEKTSRKLRRRLRKDADPKCGSHGSLQDLADVGRSGEPKSKDGPSSASFVTKHGPYDNDDENRLNQDHNSLLHNGNLESVQDFQHFFCGDNKPAELIDSTITIPLTYIKGSLTQNGLEDPDAERTCINEALKVVRCLEPVLDNKDDSLSTKESIYPSEKKVDENGNALNSSSAERKGKCRRLKAKNDKNTIMSHHIEGHRSDIAQDIDALMQYIESPTKNDGDIKSSTNRQQRSHTQRMSGSSGSGCKLRPHRDKSSDTVRKGQRKNKDNNKFKKSTSLEELSISKFEDLTSSEANNNRTETITETYRLREEVVKTEPSSSTLDEKSQFTEIVACKVLNEVVSMPLKRSSVILQGTSPQRKETVDAADSLDSMEFHTVTKKQRKKKDKMSSGQNKYRNKVHNFQVNSVKQDRNFYPYESKPRNLFKRNHIWQRRKSTSSVPSSDKSGESCDDLDSVHSLPISTSSARAMCNDINKASNSTVSYAAIARSVPSPLKQGNGEGQNLDAVDKTSSWSSPEDNVPLPDLIPSVMLPLPSKKEKPKVAPVVNNPDDYPPLSSDARDDSSRDMFVEYTVIVPKKEKCTYSNNNNINDHQESASVEKTVVVKMPPTKNPSPVSQVEQIQHTVKRPAVILMSENKEPSVVQDLEFGFEINQQLLSSSLDNGTDEDFPQDDDEEEEDDDDWASLKSTTISENATNETQTDAKAVATSSSSSSTKTDSEGPKEINPLVAFINSEWELVMKELALDRESKTGKVVYYSAETH